MNMSAIKTSPRAAWRACHITNMSMSARIIRMKAPISVPYPEPSVHVAQQPDGADEQELDVLEKRRLLPLDLVADELADPGHNEYPNADGKDGNAGVGQVVQRAQEEHGNQCHAHPQRR